MVLVSAVWHGFEKYVSISVGSKHCFHSGVVVASDRIVLSASNGGVGAKYDDPESSRAFS